MAYVQKLALVLGIISAIVNVYALLTILVGATPHLPGFVWLLHIGVFVCFAPAMYRRTKRISASNDSNQPPIEAALRGGQRMLEGVSMLPFYLLWAYAMGYLLIQLTTDALDSDTPWLFFSIGWMMMYYVSWAMLRDEASQQMTV